MAKPTQKAPPKKAPVKRTRIQDADFAAPKRKARGKGL